MLYAFVEENVIVKGTFDLAATVAIPKGSSGKMPAVVIVCGSGGGDRDGNLKKAGLNMNLYKMLSDFLAERGFVTIRYDKRGVGQSGGEAIKTGMKDLLDDVVSNIQYVKALPYVDAARVLLLGHSEGCILTTLASSKERVAGLILISGAGVGLKTSMVCQNMAVYDEIQQMKGLKGALLKKVMTREKILAKVQNLFDKVNASTKDVMRIQLVKFPAKWLREHLAISDDAVLDLLAKADCPVLAITGEKDVQTNPEDLKRVEALGKSHITSVIIPDMDHMLREYTGKKSIMNIKKQYISEMKQGLSPNFLKELDAWLVRQYN